MVLLRVVSKTGFRVWMPQRSGNFDPQTCGCGKFGGLADDIQRVGLV